MVADAKGGVYVADFGLDPSPSVAARGLDAVLVNHPTPDLVNVFPASEAGLVAGDMHFPSGSAISSKHDTLYVVATLTAAISAFQIGNSANPHVGASGLIPSRTFRTGSP